MLIPQELQLSPNTTNTKKMQQKQNKYGLSVYHAVKPAHKKDLSVSCHPTSIAR